MAPSKIKKHPLPPPTPISTTTSPVFSPSEKNPAPSTQAQTHLPTPAASTDLQPRRPSNPSSLISASNTSTTSTTSTNLETPFALPPAALSSHPPSPARSRRSSTLVAAQSTSTTTTTTIPNASSSGTRKKAAKASASGPVEYTLPPPPSRARKIIHMKSPRAAGGGAAADAAASGSAASGSGGPTSKGSAASSGGAGAVKAGTKRKAGAGAGAGNAGGGAGDGAAAAVKPTTAAGRKIARKTAHSLIERRRRSKMNEEFGVLKGLIPACEGVEMHKLAILQASIDYMRYLSRCLEEQSRFLEELRSVHAQCSQQPDSHSHPESTSAAGLPISAAGDANITSVSASDISYGLPRLEDPSGSRPSTTGPISLAESASSSSSDYSPSASVAESISPSDHGGSSRVSPNIASRNEGGDYLMVDAPPAHAHTPSSHSFRRFPNSSMAAGAFTVVNFKGQTQGDNVHAHQNHRHHHSAQHHHHHHLHQQQPPHQPGHTHHNHHHHNHHHYPQPPHASPSPSILPLPTACTSPTTSLLVSPAVDAQALPQQRTGSISDASVAGLGGPSPRLTSPALGPERDAPAAGWEVEVGAGAALLMLGRDRRGWGPGVAGGGVERRGMSVRDLLSG